MPPAPRLQPDAVPPPLSISTSSVETVATVKVSGDFPPFYVPVVRMQQPRCVRLVSLPQIKSDIILGLAPPGRWFPHLHCWAIQLRCIQPLLAKLTDIGYDLFPCALQPFAAQWASTEVAISTPPSPVLHSQSQLSVSQQNYPPLSRTPQPIPPPLKAQRTATTYAQRPAPASP
eukprot:TRINITY_DN1681_c0_g1_i1.p1 TRINITY_DN1681_c0_g1~~TRINITY_DN1681_c0_g1_i1.p1  ORF type:complete len:174 (+),score=34.34 TRINITY_DN1681_c0_g1_i1:511-1032(+)